jgi:predicted nuclease with TOPRIM domain
MNGDQTNNEILRAIGSLEGAVRKLSEDMGKLCEFKDELLATKQEFADYKEVRKDLPNAINDLKTRADRLESSYARIESLTETNAADVATLRKWADRISGIQLFMEALILIVATAGPFLLWWWG